MKRFSFLALLLIVCAAVAFSTTFPVFEPFNGPVVWNTYDQFWPTLDATLESVAAGTDGIPDSPMGDGWMGKCSAENTAGSTSGQLTGDYTDADYTLQAYLWTPVVDSPDGQPDAYWYQMLVFYRITDVENPTNYGYGRLHAHFNEDDMGITTYPPPRIRLQITNPSFVHTTGWTSPTDFTHSEGWHKFKVEVSGTTANCYYDDALLGLADWTSDEPERSVGKFGFGQYFDGAGTPALYIDNFKAWATGVAEPPDPTPTPEPTPQMEAQNWTCYE